MKHRYAGRKAARALRLIVPAALVVGLVGPGTASAAPAPIKVAGLFTEGASVGFPTTSSRTLKAFFKDYNAKGGFKGRKVEVLTGNDGFSVEKSVGLTKQMIDDGAVAFVGTTSFSNCIANAGLYSQAGVYSIGFGGAAQCFGLKQFGSVSQSTSTQLALAANYARQNIGGKVCMMAYAVPGSELVYDRAAQIFSKLGGKFAYNNTGIAPTADPTGAMVAAKNAGCRATVALLGLGQEIQMVKAKAAQRIRNMDLLLIQAHDYKFLKPVGKDGEGIYAFSYLYPFTENDSRTKSYRRFLNKYNIANDQFAEPTYASAQLFVEALKRVKGPVTRKSVGAAIAKLDVKNSLLPGGRFKFGGTGGNNAPITGAYMLRIKNNKFVKAPKSELKLPASALSLAGK